MNYAQAIFGQNGTARRGACPTLHQPMQTGDGLLARVRVVGSVVTPAQLAELARLASEHGNGLIEITARGNLQVRGLRSDTTRDFARSVADVLEIETGLVVDTSPIAGIDPHERADPMPLVRRIRDTAAGFAERLGPKVSVVIDGGGQISLAAVKADIRLLASENGRWAVTLGGGKPQDMDEDGAVAAALALLGAIAALGPEARATDLFPGPSSIGRDTAPSSAPRKPDLQATRLEIHDGYSTAIALPFGQIEGAALVALMEAALAADITTLRLAPAHRLLIDGASAELIQYAATLGFTIDADDPRRRISACIGNQGCASGHIAARQIASRLAAQLSPHEHLHVSGCAKGCAHPRAAAMTLVGRPDGIGLVINGRAGDTPEHILDEAALVATLASSRDRR